MNKVLKALIVVLFSMFLTLCANAQEAEPIDYYITTYFPETIAAFSPKNISDNNVDTSTTLLSGCGIELNTNTDKSTSPDSIGYVYVKFATTPVTYTITYNRTVGTVAYNTGDDDMCVISAGENGFLHELTVIDDNVSSIMITSEYDMKVADILLFSCGELPPDIQRWEPTLDEYDMLCFPTHADDESLFMGALIAESVARGRLVQAALICNDKKDPERPHEFLDAVWTLGIRTYPIIGNFRDHYSQSLRYASTQYDTDEMRGFIVECIRRTKPSVVVAHDIDGEYGHGAHMLTSLLVREAIELTDNSESYPESASEYGVHKVKKLFLHLYNQNNIRLDVHKTYDALGGKSPFDLAVAAYDCHVSQHVWTNLYVRTTGDYDCSSFGLYYSDVGYDVASGDVFEGVDRVIPKIASTLDTSESLEFLSLSESTTPVHLLESDTESDPVQDAFSRTGVNFCIILAAFIILYGLISTRHR